MFAVIKTGGKQYRVQVGDVLQVEKLNQEKGKKVNFDKVLLIGDDGEPLIGTPYVQDAVVKAEVVENFKDKKIIVFKKKRRKQYKKKVGHRQEQTKIRIEEIIPSIKAVPKKKPAEIKKKPEEKITPKKATPKKETPKAEPKVKATKEKAPAKPKEKKEARKEPVKRGKAVAPKTQKTKAKTPAQKKSAPKAAAKAKK